MAVIDVPLGLWNRRSPQQFLSLRNLQPNRLAHNIYSWASNSMIWHCMFIVKINKFDTIILPLTIYHKSHQPYTEGHTLNVLKLLE